MIERIRRQAVADALRITVHAHQRMVEEAITLDQILEALADCEILEDYP